MNVPHKQSNRSLDVCVCVCVCVIGGRGCRGLARFLLSFKCDLHSAHAQWGFLGTLRSVPDVWKGSSVVLLMQVST